MCRFVAYSGSAILMTELIFKASNSLVNQSRKARMRLDPLNGDGFGIGWYPDHDDHIPGTFVSIEPAWSNRNLIQLAAKIRTKHFFAHVRDASEGMPVAQNNCHPFQYGPFLWMHNGRLDKFELFRRKILNDLSHDAFHFIKGNTDSEYAFAMFLDEINFDVSADEPTLKQAMINTIKRIYQYRSTSGANTNADINFALTNGKTSLFTRLSSDVDIRPASLFYKITDSGVVVSSEPLCITKENWVKVERNSLLCITDHKLSISDLLTLL